MRASGGLSTESSCWVGPRGDRASKLKENVHWTCRWAARRWTQWWWGGEKGGDAIRRRIRSAPRIVPSTSSYFVPPPHTPLQCPASSAIAALKILLLSPWRRARIGSAGALSSGIRKTSPSLSTNTAHTSKIPTPSNRLREPNRKLEQPVSYPMRSGSFWLSCSWCLRLSPVSVPRTISLPRRGGPQFPQEIMSPPSSSLTNHIVKTIPSIAYPHQIHIPSCPHSRLLLLPHNPTSRKSTNQILKFGQTKSF